MAAAAAAARHVVRSLAPYPVHVLRLQRPAVDFFCLLVWHCIYGVCGLVPPKNTHFLTTMGSLMQEPHHSDARRRPPWVSLTRLPHTVVVGLRHISAPASQCFVMIQATLAAQCR